MTEKPRKAWLVRTDVPTAELEDTLNTLEQDSYQVFKIEAKTGVSYDVIACDPSLIGQRQGAALAKSMGLLRDTVAAAVAAGQVGPAPGVTP